MAAYCSHVDPVYAVRRSANSLIGYGEEKMFKKDKPARDAFTFSLAGTKTVTSFTPAPAIADDRFNQAPVRRESVQRPWMCFYHQAAYFPCA